MEKRDAGKELFLAGNTLAEIANKLNVPERTVKDWSTKGKWMDKRVKAQVFGETREEQILEIIDYNLCVLRERVAEYRSETAGKLIEKDEIESLVRLYSMVRGGQSKFNDYVKLLRRALEYIQRDNSDAAKAAIPAFDLLINDLSREA